MIEHMVWIRFRPGCGQQRVAQHLDALRSLAQSVPGVRSLRVGPNVTDRAGGYTHGLIVSFDDTAGLNAYLDHPEHVKVADPLKQDADLLAMDIEC